MVYKNTLTSLQFPSLETGPCNSSCGNWCTTQCQCSYLMFARMSYHLLVHFIFPLIPESVFLLQFHGIFADLYSFLFGSKAKLAKKPKPWRISLLLEVIYGGWTLVCNAIMAVFTQCKDIELLTSVNLIDNYVVFKSNSYNLYCKFAFFPVKIFVSKATSSVKIIWTFPLAAKSTCRCFSNYSSFCFCLQE